MNLLRMLLAKDLRRLRRNPQPWLTHLAVPFVITALLGLAFGAGRGERGSPGRIRFALVDEDRSPLTQLLRGVMNQGEAGRRLEPVFLARAEALRQIADNQLSAVVIIPAHFTRDYLEGRAPAALELIKNPARSIHPAVLEELLGVVVTGLNALARNLAPEFPAWREVFADPPDYRQVADLILRAGEKIEALGRYLDPPLITYNKDVRAGEARTGAGVNLFGFVLIGMATMFLLFQANVGIEDLHREFAGRTFERYHTLQEGLMRFLAAKGVFVGVVLLLSAGFMLGGGGLAFGIRWRHPLEMSLLVLGFAVFGAGYAAVFAALLADVRRADALSNLIAMGLGLAGGCAFPAQALPAFMREHITPYLPSAWLVEGLRGLEFGNAPVDWPLILLRLVAVGAALLGLAAELFRRRLARGLRA